MWLVTKWRFNVMFSGFLSTRATLGRLIAGALLRGRRHIGWKGVLDVHRVVIGRCRGEAVQPNVANECVAIIDV